MCVRNESKMKTIGARKILIQKVKVDFGEVGTLLNFIEHTLTDAYAQT